MSRALLQALRGRACALMAAGLLCCCGSVAERGSARAADGGLLQWSAGAAGSADAGAAGDPCGPACAPDARAAGGEDAGPLWSAAAADSGDGGVSGDPCGAACAPEAGASTPAPPAPGAEPDASPPPQPPNPFTYAYSSWTAWSPCSSDGVQTRSRSCVRQQDTLSVDCALCGGVCDDERGCGVVAAPPPPTETPQNTLLCPGTYVDRTGQSAADTAISQCIAAAPNGGVLSIPAGVYRIQNSIAVNRGNLTITTAGLLGNPSTCAKDASISCATFTASPTLADTNGLFYVKNGTGLTIDHLIFDGNRKARLSSAAAADCIASSGGSRTLGRNVMVYSGTNTTLQYSASINALCATAVAWGLTPMSGSVIRANYIADNGEDYLHANSMWSDGLTIGAISDATISNNTFKDNTDVDLILGGATGNTQITANLIQHSAKTVFAGFMITNWSSPFTPANAQWADFRGMHVTGNTINCGDFCDIAVQLGVYAWYWNATYWANFRTLGGEFTKNTIYGNKQGINVNGVGTANYAMSVYHNTVVSAYGAIRENTPLYGRVKRTSTLNVPALWSESFVNLGSGPMPGTTDPWHGLY